MPRYAPWSLAIGLLFVACGGSESPVSSNDDQRTPPLSGAIVGLAGKCLNVAEMGTTPNTPVVTWPCEASANEEWTLLGDGLIHGYGNQCLTVKNGNRANGTAIVMSTCQSGLARQQWTFDSSGQIRGLGGKCLNVYGGSTDPGTQVILWDCGSRSTTYPQDCSYQDNDRWTFRPDLTIRLQAVFLTDDDGNRPMESGAEVTPQIIAAKVRDMNQTFAAGHVQFVYDQVKDTTTVASTALNSLSCQVSAPAFEGEALAFAARYPGKMIVFYRFGADPRTREYGGCSSPPIGPGNGLRANYVLMPSTTGTTAGLAHEVGHYLGLDHTFVQDPRGNDLATPQAIWNYAQLYGDGLVDTFDGDGLCDTPPDPDAAIWSYNGYGACDAAHPTVDVYGMLFTPDRNNAMSYFGCPPTHFTPMQHAKMRSMLAKPARGALVSPGTATDAREIFGMDGMCLYPDYTSYPILLQLRSCTGSADEKFTFSKSGQIRTKGKCLHAGQGARGNHVFLDTCRSLSDEYWSRAQNGEIISSLRGQCLNVSGGQANENAEIVLWDCTPSASNEKWWSYFQLPAPVGPPN